MAATLPSEAPTASPLRGRRVPELARYRVDVYELRTHRKLGSTTFVGADSACPSSKLSNETLNSRPSTDQHRGFFAPFVG